MRHKGSAHVPRSIWRVPRLRPVGGAAAVVQVSGINKGTYTLIYHSVMSLLVIDFTFLDGRDGYIVVKELAAVNFQRNRYSYIFKKPYGLEAVSMFTAELNEAVDHGCNWNESDITYSELETVLHREASSAVAFYCYVPQKTKFISELIQRTVIDIGQLGCPDLEDMRLPTISCMFACHKSKHVCALRTAYSLAQWLNYYTLSLQYVKCSPQPAFH
jgi:hypothetical protein